MKNLKGYIISYLVLAVFGVVVYPLVEILYNKINTGEAFVYSFKTHFIAPLIYAAVYIVFSTLYKKIFKKK